MYHRSLRGVEEVTDRFQSMIPGVSYDKEAVDVYETTVDAPFSALTPQGLISIARAVGVGYHVLDIENNVNAVLVRPEGSVSRVQVVMGKTEWYTIPAYKELSDAVAAAITKETGLRQMSSPRILLATGKEAEFFKPSHGVAPLFVSQNDQLVATKAAADPNPKQILTGTIEKLSEAVPFVASPVPVTPVPPGIDPVTGEAELSLPAKIILGGIFLAGTYAAASWWREQNRYS